jgi:hypothetical protein
VARWRAGAGAHRSGRGAIRSETTECVTGDHCGPRRAEESGGNQACLARIISKGSAQRGYLNTGLICEMNRHIIEIICRSSFRCEA